MSFKTRLQSLFGLEQKSLAAPDDCLSDIFDAVPSVSGVTVSPRSAMTCAPVRAAVATISEPLGMLPVHVYKRTADGSKERATDHPAYALLNDRVNDFMSASTFRELMTADALRYPNGALAFIARNAEGKPVNLFRLDPSRTTVKVVMDDFTGPTYTVTENGKSRVIPTRDLLHLASPSLTGRGLVGDASEAIALSLLLERHAARLFANSARPSGVLSLKGVVSPDALMKAKAAWIAAHGGDKTGGVAVVPSDAEWQSLTMTSVDSQFAEMRRFSIEEIARFFNVSPIFLQDLGRATWANSEQAKDNLLSVTLLPWITKWQDEIALKLFSDDERAQYVCEFKTEAFVHADYKSKTEGISKLISARVISPNEARAMMNLPPYAGGDEFVNPNVQAAGSA